MTNIDPIRFGVTNQFVKKDPQENVVNNEEKAAPQAGANKEVNSNEIFGFLAAKNADLVPAKAKKTVDVSKYVNPEQAARIANFMKGFETDVDEISAAALNEFPDLSQEAADGIALALINASY